MANFSFASFNTKHNEYMSLEDLAKRDGLGKEYQFKKAWINYKSSFNPETAVVELQDCRVNIPAHQVFEVKDMLEDENTVDMIEAGCAGFKIREYTKTLSAGKGKKQIKKTCYAAEWIDVDPDDFPDYSDDDDEDNEE